MLSQIVRNNSISSKNVRTKASKYVSIPNFNEQSEELEKLSEYVKEQINEPQISEVNEDYICENPNEVIVDFSGVYKEKEEQLPFFKSIQAQLQAIYG